MRVAFVSMSTTHHRETRHTARIRRVAERLAADGHDVTHCCVQWWDGDHDTFDYDGITYRAVTADGAPRAFASKLPFALRKVGPDVVHVATDPPLAVSAAKTAGRVLRTPVVADWWATPGDDDGYRRAVRAADAILAPSRTVETQVREYGADAADVHVVPDSVDMALVRDAPVDDRADLVYARDVDAHANVENFLLALAELRGHDWRAAVVGDGPERAAAERTAADLRIDDRVEFLGDLPPEERVPILKGAHVFVQTATWEPFATDLLWALACGCVGVVEYQAGSSAHELVEGQPRGSLVTNPQEIADEIVAAADVERWTVDEGYAEYDHDAVVDRYLGCYREEIDAYGFF
jgi:glycosyltransferase involved in cell wall biosynthesis